MNKFETLKHFYETFPKKERVDFNDFKKIIDFFNLRMSEEISKGHEIHTSIGIFKVLRNEKDLRISTPNWKLSNEKKKEILSRGGKPFNKRTAPDGEEWLVYHNEKYIYKTVWKRSKMVKFSPFYKFHSYKTHKERVAEMSRQGMLDLI